VEHPLSEDSYVALQDDIGSELGFDTVAVPMLSLSGRPCSSTQIRQALQTDDPDPARRSSDVPTAPSLVQHDGQDADLVSGPGHLVMIIHRKPTFMLTRCCWVGRAFTPHFHG
jgi:hypothetical protein